MSRQIQTFTKDNRNNWLRPSLLVSSWSGGRQYLLGQQGLGTSNKASERDPPSKTQLEMTGTGIAKISTDDSSGLKHRSPHFPHQIWLSYLE